jgi:hypothetical protein
MPSLSRSELNANEGTNLDLHPPQDEPLISHLTIVTVDESVRLMPDLLVPGLLPLR